MSRKDIRISLVNELSSPWESRLRLSKDPSLLACCYFYLNFRLLSGNVNGFLACLLFALALTAAQAAPAPGIARADGERLLRICTAAQQLIGGETLGPEQREDAQLCIGFLEGFVWGHGWAAWRRGIDMYFCPPEGFTYRDAVPALVGYLRNHPERLIQRAHLLVFSALSSAFPCTP